MKITNKYITYFALLLSIILVVSCEDEDKDFINSSITKDNAAFVRFDENPPTAIGLSDPSELTYSFNLLDANNNVASYDLKIYALLSGVETDTVDVATVTSFPADFSFDAQDFASFFGRTVDELSFGDQFFFTAKATSTSGQEYGAAIPVGLIEIFEQEDGTYLNSDDRPVTIGPGDQVVTNGDGSTFRLRGDRLADELITETGYRQAFEFEFVILCPEFIRADAIGTYTITDDPFGVANTTFEVLAGATDNEVIIRDLFEPGNDIIMTVDPVTSACTFDKTFVAAAFFGYAGGNIESTNATSYFFDCIGTLAFDFEYTVDLGSFGTRPLKAAKN